MHPSSEASTPLPGISANISTILPGHPLPDRLAAIGRAGVSAVESWWPFPTATPSQPAAAAFTTALADSGLRLDGLNFTGGDPAAGEKGLLSIPGREADFRASVDIAVTIGEQLGTRVFNALYGNLHNPAELDKHCEVATANLIYAARAAHRIGATVLLEPLSGAPDYPLRRLAHAAAAIDAAGQDAPAGSIRILADLYHLTVNGLDVAAEVDAYADRINHVQIADAPGRGAPGSGSSDLTAIVTRIRANGYRDPIALEYLAEENPFAWIGFNNELITALVHR